MDTTRLALHTAARRRAHELRQAALDDAWAHLVAWLRRTLHAKAAPCRS